MGLSEAGNCQACWAKKHGNDPLYASDEEVRAVLPCAVLEVGEHGVPLVFRGGV